ncbi:MAG: hypothetical protein QOF73_3565 [Thermomicrobiales bacterium]|nr:hypothetical protein [Thermomicrobiales bacterium]
MVRRVPQCSACDADGDSERPRLPGEVSLGEADPGPRGPTEEASVRSEDVDWQQRAELAMRALAADPDGFRRRRRRMPLLPYEQLDIAPWPPSAGLQDLVERRLTDGYRSGSSSLQSIVGPIEWLAHHRTFAFEVNAWEPISAVLMGHSRLQDGRYLAAAQGFARRWLEQFQVPSFAIGPDPGKLDAAFGPTPWYDMAVGLRAYRLAYLVDIAARDPRHDGEDVRLGLHALLFHLQLLSQDRFFRGHNNHGLYQALGELAVCRRFRDEPFFGERLEAARARLHDMIDRQFHPDGLHMEHSPGYHVMVTRTLIGARRSGLIPAAGAGTRLAAAEETMTWLIQPGGALLTFGDTDPTDVRQPPGIAENFDNPRLRYQLSGGAIGERPPGGVLVLKDEGCVFARSEAPEKPGEPWWYLGQIASFQSRAHKHADDLGFVWSDRGGEILIDPGRYGYTGKTERGSDLARQGFWYADPKRIYVESTRAHNAVEIDGRSYDRTRAPYGSALVSGGEWDGLIVTECQHRPIRSVRHIRLLAMAPGRFLLVVDWLFDRTGRKHDVRQHFHFHPDWTVAPDPSDDTGQRLLAARAGTDQRLTVLPLLADQGPLCAVRGREEPELLGWYSDKADNLVPCATVVSEHLATDFALFATLFTFGIDAAPAPQWTAGVRAMRPVRFAWEEAGTLVRIAIERADEGRPVSAVLRHGR